MTYIPALRNVESTSNSTSTPLGSNGVYTGTIEDILYFTQIELCAFSDVDSGTLGMSLQFCDINDINAFNNPKTLGSIHIRESLAGGSYFYKKYEGLSRYFRIVYTNGATAQNTFRLKIILSSDQKKSDVIRGFNSNVEIPIGNIVDAFGRNRISEPITLFESKIITNSDPFNWSRLNTSGQLEATSFVYNIGQPYMKLFLGSNITGKIVSQSRKYVPYLPGKSALVIVTGSLITRTGSTASQATTRIGYFDDKVDKTLAGTNEIKTGDGWFFQCVDDQNGTGNNFTLSIVERSSIDENNPTNPTQTDIVVPQANWNNDRLDGTGPSGFILDPRNKTLFFFNFQWLGVGIASMGVVVGGKQVTCHVFTHYGTGPLPYSTRPSLPIRYEISRTATVAVPVNLTRVCSTVISEGGFNPTGLPFTVTNRTTGKLSGTATSGVEIPVLAIRTRAGKPRVTTIIQSCGIYTFAGATNTHAVYSVRLYRIIGQGVTVITGGTWTSVNSESAVEANNAITSFTLTGTKNSIVFEQNYAISRSVNSAGSTSFGNIIDCLSDIAGNPDYYLLTTTTVNGANSNDTSYGTLSWVEYE